MKRQENQSFEDYKLSRATANKYLKRRAKGRLIWVSKVFKFIEAHVDIHGTKVPGKMVVDNELSNGTYVKATHGPIGAKTNG